MAFKRLLLFMYTSNVIIQITLLKQGLTNKAQNNWLIGIEYTKGFFFSYAALMCIVNRPFSANFNGRIEHTKGFSFSFASAMFLLGLRLLIAVDKFTNKIQVRQVEKTIQKFQTIGINFGNRPIVDFLRDQIICITDCDNLTIGHSFSGFSFNFKNLLFDQALV